MSMLFCHFQAIGIPFLNKILSSFGIPGTCECPFLGFEPSKRRPFSIQNSGHWGSTCTYIYMIKLYLYTYRYILYMLHKKIKLALLKEKGRLKVKAIHFL